MLVFIYYNMLISKRHGSVDIENKSVHCKFKATDFMIDSLSI